MLLCLPTKETDHGGRLGHSRMESIFAASAQGDEAGQIREQLKLKALEQERVRLEPRLREIGHE